MKTSILNTLKANENVSFWADRVIATRNSRDRYSKFDAAKGLEAAARLVCFEEADKAGGFDKVAVDFHLSNKITVLKHKNLFFGGEAYRIEELAQ